MRVLEVRNVHEALPRAIKLLYQEGIQRDSRNGPVLQMPCPVTTVYNNPLERVLFWPDRDANPFFHLYESLWMLQGRNDIAPLVKYAKQIAEYSDDGVTQHGAYGYRWRHAFGVDQLGMIAARLRENPEDRRQMLQMWNTADDLNYISKDLPCNTIASFQRNTEGALDLTVFCRSNDIIWGAYGANAVHFSMLLEYMANWIECPVGKYYQVSVNWHGYLKTLEPLKSLPAVIDSANYVLNPYNAHILPTLITGTHAEVDAYIQTIIQAADSNKMSVSARPFLSVAPWAHVFYTVLEAHEIYRQAKDDWKFRNALRILNQTVQCDWVIAAKEWLQRRYDRYQNKEKLLGGELSHP